MISSITSLGKIAEFGSRSNRRRCIAELVLIGVQQFQPVSNKYIPCVTLAL
jgi:hypothetical protein